MTDNRFPRSVYRHGSDPDPRFTMANERTFLAWIRTSLAFIAGALALEALDIPLQPTLRIIATVLFLGLGLSTPIYAWVAWCRNERALRTNTPLHGPSMSMVISVALTAVVIILALGLVLDSVGT